MRCLEKPHKRIHNTLSINISPTSKWVEAEVGSIPQIMDKRSSKSSNIAKTLECLPGISCSGPNKRMFASLLKACVTSNSLEEGRHVHALAVQSGCDSNAFVGSCLIDMYAKCGGIEDAWHVFNKISAHNVITWSTMIAAYVRSGDGSKALDLFQQMQKERFEPNGFTLVGALNACASMAALQEGRHLHALVIESGLDSNIFVASGLMDMYAKCNSIEDVCEVFAGISELNIVMWNTMIKGYTSCNQAGKALQLFHIMHLEQVKPDGFTLVGVLNACSSLGTLEEGKRVHACIIQNAMETNLFVSNCLINMYIRCGSIEDADRVFSHMPVRDAVSWTSMIAGFAACGLEENALYLFYKMTQCETNPNSATFVSMLKTCATMAALADGRYVHAQAIRCGYGSDIAVQNCLIHVYMKCGSIWDACRVFNNMPKRDIVSWNAMIMACGVHGIHKEALQIFDDMDKQNVHVDSCTFMSLLSVVSHAGLVDVGYYYLESMNAVYGISPTVQHYDCLIVTLGRSGHIQNALDIIANMGCEPDAWVWMSLVGACRLHNDVQVEQYAFNKIMDSGYLDHAFGC